MKHDVNPGTARPRQLTLEEWLKSLETTDRRAWTWSFPNDTVKAEYLNSIAGRSEDDVRTLLRHFLISSGTLGIDESRLVSLQWLRRRDPKRFEAARRKESVRRLLASGRSGQPPPWEGITWVLDLLPRWPMQAIDVLQAYFLAHMFELPDGRIDGIADAQAVIRTMWMGNPVSGEEKRELVFQLGHRRFEHLVESLYAAMGFATTLTPPRRDGGRDVIATTEVPGDKQRILIECKLWRHPVGIPVLRALLGAVSHERSTKGVIAAGGHFTSPARTFAAENARIELLDWSALLRLLDRYLGADWGLHADRLIAASIIRAGGRE